MSTRRSKRITVRTSHQKGPISSESGDNNDISQAKVTKYFATVHRTNQTGSKRSKIQLSQTETTTIAKLETEAQDVFPFPEQTQTLVTPEENTQQNISSEKSGPEIQTPENPIPPDDSLLSPRVRKKSVPVNIHTTAERASRSLVFQDDGQDFNKTPPKSPLEAPNVITKDASITVKATEMAGIVKFNAGFRDALKDSIKSSSELQTRLKSVINPKSAEILRKKMADIRASKLERCTKSPPKDTESADSEKFKFKSEIQTSDKEKPSTSTVLPNYVLPLHNARLIPKQTTPTKKNFDILDYENAQRSPLKHGRACLLVSEVKKCANLPLPIKYERLCKLFAHMERVVTILHSQDRRITLDEVSRNVQKNVKCSFTKQHFSQMLSVYPKSFSVRLEEHWAPIGGVRGHENRYDYVIEPNLNDDIINYMRDDNRNVPDPEPQPSPSKNFTSPLKFSPLKSPRAAWLSSPFKNLVQSSKKTPNKVVDQSLSIRDSRPKMEAWRTAARACIFRYRILDFVTQHHATFLEKLGVEMSAEDLRNLRRYHPDFDLDKIPDIPEAELPEPPRGDQGLPKTMRDYMRVVEDSASTLPAKVKEMINELRSPEKQAALAAGARAALGTEPGTSTCVAPQKAKMSLLQRIRAKEQARKRAEMMRDPVDEIRKGRLEKLSRSTLRNICSYYAFKKANTMAMSEMVSKLVFSDTNSTKGEMESLIQLLCEVAPAYFSLKSIRELQYVHIRKMDFQAVNSLIIQQLNTVT